MNASKSFNTWSLKFKENAWSTKILKISEKNSPREENLTHKLILSLVNQERISLLRWSKNHPKKLQMMQFLTFWENITSKKMSICRISKSLDKALPKTSQMLQLLKCRKRLIRLLLKSIPEQKEKEFGRTNKLIRIVKWKEKQKREF